MGRDQVDPPSEPPIHARPAPELRVRQGPGPTLVRRPAAGPADPGVLPHRGAGRRPAPGLPRWSALALANSPWGGPFARFLETHLAVEVGRWALRGDIRELINDGLMTVFFYVAGLEIKRELLEGRLSSLRRAALPVVAALGGMVVPGPALLRPATSGGPGAHGWGIPMATDIAFSVGVLILLGDRVPPPARVFLLALAIADDIGAILVIAVFYSHGDLLGGPGRWRRRSWRRSRR